jgi:predicted transcriptional regulator
MFDATLNQQRRHQEQRTTNNTTQQHQPRQKEEEGTDPGTTTPRMSPGSASSSSRKPPKKRSFIFSESEDEDDYALLSGGPTFARHSSQQQQQSAASSPPSYSDGQVAVRRTSPRRSSVATLDATASPSVDILTQTSSPGSDAFDLMDSAVASSAKPAPTKKKTRKSVSPQINDSLVGATSSEATFTLNKVQTTTSTKPAEPSSTKNAEKANKSKKKKRPSPSEAASEVVAPVPKKHKKSKKKNATAAVAVDENTKEAPVVPVVETASKENQANATRPACTAKGETPPAKPLNSNVVKPKTKKKKATLQDTIFSHMYLSMKPFTLKSLADELRSTDTILNGVMLSLVGKGLVAKKDFASSKGRTKTIYWAVDGVQSKEVAVLASIASPAERKTTTTQYQTLQSQLESLQKTLAAINSDLSNAEIDSKLQQEEASRNEMQQQVEALRNRLRAPAAQPPKLLGRAKGPPKIPSTPRRLKRRINDMRDEWKSRKQKCTDCLDQLCDAMEKKPKDLVKMLDVETDEMCGVKLPQKLVVEAVASSLRKR